MANFYDDAKFGVINRKWFGLTKKYGGDCASGYTFTGSGSTVTHLARWYPKGPIQIRKVGFRVLATLATAANAAGGAARSKIQLQFSHSGNNATSRAVTIATTHINVGDASPTAHPRPAIHTIASNPSPTVANRTIAAGQFLTIYAATPMSDDGTMAAAVGTLSMGGTLAFFVDYIPSYGSQWDS